MATKIAREAPVVIAEPAHLSRTIEYRYQPLRGENAIRMLTLSSGHSDDPLKGCLETIQVDSAGDYEAISYVWADAGPPGEAYEILIHDEIGKEGLLKLRGGSIFAVLRQIRHPDQPRRIWADQCCINQEDAAERGQQVQFMSRIYRNARHVLVWLGLDPNHEAATAFGLIHELDEVLVRQHGEGGLSSRETQTLERRVRDNHDAIQALTNRPWFKRGWIVQEIGTVAPATLHWGDEQIEWNLLANVCEDLKSYHHLRSSLNISTSDVSFLFRRFIEPNERTHHANRYNLVYELQRSRHLQFSDDRDRVFAFLGHFSVQSQHSLSCGPVDLHADYTKSVEQTYQDVAMQLLRANANTSCILMASVQHARRSLPSSEQLSTWLGDEMKLPSWVPDWRHSEGIILAEPICPHRAHGSTNAKIEILEDKHPRLRIHGVTVDTVEQCSEPLQAKDLYLKQSSWQASTTIEQLWHDVCGMNTFNLQDRYVGGQSAFFAFMQTLSNGCVQLAGHKCVPYDEIPDAIWLQKAARHIAESITAPEKVSKELFDVAGALNVEDDGSKWVRWAVSASEGRIFGGTTKGYYVLGPTAMEAGDIICVLFGSKVPFCLRPVGEQYLLVGECYVHGLMKGEAMGMLARDDISEEGFVII